MSDISSISTTFIIFFTFILQYIIYRKLELFYKKDDFFEKKKHRKTFQVQKKQHLNQKFKNNKKPCSATKSEPNSSSYSNS